MVTKSCWLRTRTRLEIAFRSILAAFLAFSIFSSSSVIVVAAPNPQLTSLSLEQAPSNTGPWTALSGNLSSGFTLPLSGISTGPTDFIYVNISFLTSSTPLKEMYHPFWLITTGLPTGFYTYWDAKGVNASATLGTWQAAMWPIIQGIDPIFYLKVSGTTYTLVDGLVHNLGAPDEYMRINPDYPLGMYSFNGSLTSADDFTGSMTINIDLIRTTFSITGNAGVVGVTLGYSVEGTPTSVMSGLGGAYDVSIPYGWSGSITPEKAGYTFLPISIPFTNVIAISAGNDFTATPIEYTLTIDNLHGTVTKVPDKATYTYGEEVQLTAAADSGWTFASWSGDATGTTNPVTVTMDGNKSVTANYTQNEYTLMITSLHGSVTKVPDKATYTYGEEVQLTAAANPGWTFTSWSGDATGTTNPVTVTIDGNKSVTANYTPNEYTLTITSLHGTVTKVPDKATYTYGEEVQLTAVANPGWNFDNWSGDLIGSTNPDFVTIQGNTDIIANYSFNTFTISGNTGISGVSIEYYDGSSKSVLTNGTGDFILTVSYNWSGSLSPVKTGYHFTPAFLDFTNVLSNQTGADFTAVKNSYQLTVNKAGNGNGEVWSSPEGICGYLPCAYGFDYGTVITLTAQPRTIDQDRFEGWSGGGCSGRGNCVFTITEDTTIVATFAKPTFADVIFTHPRWAYIEALYRGGYTAGCSTTGPLKYCPDKTMSRAESAVFMLRGNFGSGYVPPIAPWDTFADNWTPGYWAEKWAEGMWKEGLTAGCQSPADNPIKKFCPWDNFPRVQAAVFGLRLMHGISYVPPAATGDVLGDMTDVNFYGTKWAEQAYKDGLILSCGTVNGKPKFCPTNLLSRADSAYMIVIAKSLPLP